VAEVQSTQVQASQGKSSHFKEKRLFFLIQADPVYAVKRFLFQSHSKRFKGSGEKIFFHLIAPGG
jgi:hypothetical protein